MSVYERQQAINWSSKNIPYGHDPRQKIDITLPGKEAAHGVVFIHGGAYFTGSKSEYPMFLFGYAKEAVFVSMDYRLIDEDDGITMDDMLSDVTAALEKALVLSAARGIHIRDFILTGHSAGAHIALLYGYKYFQKNDAIPIAACVSLAGPTDFTDDCGLSSMTAWGETLEERLSFLSWVGTRLTGCPIHLRQYAWKGQEDYSGFKKQIEDISPLTYAVRRESLPPTLLVHAPGDNQVPYSNAVNLNAALDRASVPHKLITPDGYGNDHMLGMNFHTGQIEMGGFRDHRWVNEAKEWIGAYLR